jgi:hypothetical protein
LTSPENRRNLHHKIQAMRKRILIEIAMLLVASLMLLITGCTKKKEVKSISDSWDIEKSGIPKFVSINYIELSKISRISKFRSSVGHDYSDAFEQCRSMKHYFEPGANEDWSSVKIFSPVKGTITRVDLEWAGYKIEIASDSLPAFRFSIFHINTNKQYAIGDAVTAGQNLGNHIGSQTYSDIAVIVNDPTHQGRMISYFDMLIDQVFNQYILRGVGDRSELIISKSFRDSNPLSCNGDTFIGSDSIENWKELN